MFHRRRWPFWLLATGFALCLAVGAAPQARGSNPQDLNQATRAEIEAVRGVGVELTERLLKAREEGHFADWADLRRRVKGVSRRALAGFAEAGFQIGRRGPPDQN
jgi:hypothetical protein